MACIKHRDFLPLVIVMDGWKLIPIRGTRLAYSLLNYTLPINVSTLLALLRRSEQSSANIEAKNSTVHIYLLPSCGSLLYRRIYSYTLKFAVFFVSRIYLGIQTYGIAL